MLRLATLAATAVVAAAIILSTGSASSGGFQLGLVSNADRGTRAGKIAHLGARIVRIEFPVTAGPERLAPVIAAFARQGIAVLPLAGFRGRVATPAQGRNLASWARAFGPSGTFWSHRSDGQLAIRYIEFGNETNQAGQFGSCGLGCPGYAQRAREYALALKAAQEAVDGPLGDAGVGLLAIGDDGGTASPVWVNGMFEAVPDLARRIAGWTAHPYGTQPQRLLDRLVSQTAARGAPASLPIFITEVGVASDNGQCLGNNYGWNPCMSYAEAARAVSSVVTGIHARYGRRVRAIFIYQAFDQRPPYADGDREHYFGALTSSGAAKGAYTAAIRSLLRVLR